MLSPSGGSRIDRLDPDGTLSHLGSSINVGTCDQITAVGSSMVACFNRSTRVVAIGRVNVDGGYSGLQSTTVPLSYAYMAGASNGPLYFFLDSPESGIYRYQMTARVDPQGNLTNIVTWAERARPDRDWRPVAFLGTGHVLFYNPTTGQYYTGELGANGLFSGYTSRQALGQGWTGFAYIQAPRVVGAHDLLLAYRSDTGVAATKWLDDDYNLHDLKTYQGPDGPSPGWTHLITVR